MRINNTGRKHYYIFQNGKQIGRVTKKKNEFNVNNNSPVTIKRTNIWREATYYLIILACLIPCLIYARPIGILVLAFGTRIYDPFNLDSKSNIFIKRPTGTISLTDAYNYKTNADAIYQRRIYYIWIRLGFIIAAFTLLLEVCFEMMIRNLVPVLIAIFVIYALVYILLMYIYIKMAIKSYKVFKLEQTEQQEFLKKL